MQISKGEIWTCWPSLSQSWQRRRSIHKSGRWKLNLTSSVYLSYSLKLSSSLLNPGEEEGGDGDGPPAPWRESGLLRCAGTHRLSRLKAQDCSGVEGKADIQGVIVILNKTGSKITTNWKSVESEAKWEVRLSLSGYSDDEPWWCLPWKLQRIIAWWECTETYIQCCCLGLKVLDKKWNELTGKRTALEGERSD